MAPRRRGGRKRTARGNGATINVVKSVKPGVTKITYQEIGFTASIPLRPVRVVVCATSSAPNALQVVLYGSGSGEAAVSNVRPVNVGTTRLCVVAPPSMDFDIVQGPEEIFALKVVGGSSDVLCTCEVRLQFSTQAVTLVK